jgi:hypothetical protein
MSFTLNIPGAVSVQVMVNRSKSTKFLLVSHGGLLGWSGGSVPSGLIPIPSYNVPNEIDGFFRLARRRRSE